MTGFVYAIQSGSRVKLGWSANPLRRLSSIATHSPFLTHLLGATPGTKQDEARLHADFAALRLRGEWFKADTPILAHVGGWPPLERRARKRRRPTWASPDSPIIAYRQTHGLSIEAFGMLVGVKKSAVSKWERNIGPSPMGAILIEQATQGAIPRWKLRPDLWSEEEPS